MPRSAMISEPLPSSAGFYGKLPSRGDFIGRALSTAFLQPWDRWLQAAIARSRDQLGENWRERYCTSPIWRFALGPGLCGPTSHAGILMPSMDRVGRYYPMVIAAPLPPAALLLALPTTADDWFQQAERIALAGLECDQLDLEDFSRKVATLGRPQEWESAAGVATGKPWHCPLPDATMPRHVLPALAVHLLRQAFPQPSLWWTEGSDRIARCLLICDGLPPIDGFAALLSGDWPQWGWNEPSLAGIALHSDEPPAAEED